MQTALGWVYLPLHLIALPMLLNIYAAFNAPKVSAVAINLAYVCAGVVFVLLVMFSFLRRSFDPFAERPMQCLKIMLLAFAANYAMSLLLGLVYLLLHAPEENPNNAFVLDLIGEDFGPMVAMTVFLAPIVEETLIRGVVFGSIAPRSRPWAYIASTALFSLNHVWQYAIAYHDPLQLLYAVQYVPVSLALAWSYDRSGSIWTPIFFHMGFNALSFAALGS